MKNLVYIKNIKIWNTKTIKPERIVNTTVKSKNA